MTLYPAIDWKYLSMNGFCRMALSLTGGNFVEGSACLGWVGWSAYSTRAYHPSSDTHAVTHFFVWNDLHSETPEFLVSTPTSRRIVFRLTDNHDRRV